MDQRLPRPSLALVAITQALLGALFLVGLGAIAVLPGLAESTAVALPEYAELRVPLLAVAIALTILALVALAMISLLVQRIRGGSILTRSSLLWVDVFIGTLACGAALVATGAVVIGNGQAGSPFLALVEATAFLVLLALAGITLVLRSLLRHAILLRTELDEVV